MTDMHTDMLMVVSLGVIADSRLLPRTEVTRLSRQ